MPTVTQLTGQLGLDSSNFDQGLDKANEKLKSFQQLFGSMNPVFAGVTAALTGLGATVVESTLQVGDALGKIAAGTGETGDQLHQTQQRFLEDFKGMTQGIGEAAAGFTLLRQRTDLTGAALDRLLQQESQLARIQGSNLTETIDATVIAMTKWGISTQQMAPFLDRLQQISQQTGITVNQLAEYLRSMAAPLQDMGMDADHAALLLAKWDKAGINVTQTTFGLRHAIQQMASEGLPQTAEEMEKFLKHIQNLQNPTQKLSELIQLFGKRSGEELFHAMQQGTFGVEDFTRKLDNANGTISNSNQNVDPLREALADLSHEFQLAAGTSGAFRDTIIFDIQALTEFVKEVKGAADSTAEFIQYLANGFKIDNSPGVREMLKLPENIKTSMSRAQAEFEASQRDPEGKGIGNLTHKMLVDQLMNRDFPAFLRAQKDTTEESDQFWAEFNKRMQAHLKETGNSLSELSAKEESLLHPKAHKPKETPEEKLWKQLMLQVEQAHNEIDSLSEDGSVQLAKLEGKFGSLGERAQPLIHFLAGVKEQIKAITERQEEMHKFDSMLAEVNHKIVVLRSGGEESKAALRDIFPDIPDTQLNKLAAQINLRNQLKEAEERHKKAIQEEQEVERTTSNRLAESNIELLKLTHTRYEDIAALELYKKTYAEVTDEGHKQAALGLAVTLSNIDATRESIQQKREEENATKALERELQGLNLKLNFRAADTETAEHIRNIAVAFTDLSDSAKEAERESVALEHYGTLFKALSSDEQTLIDDYLQMTHALGVLEKQEKDRARALEQEKLLNADLTKRYDELTGQIHHYTDATKTAVVHSELVVKMLMDMADGAEYTSDQVEKMWKIFDMENQLPALKKQADLFKKLTDTMREEFSKLFQDIALGHKNAFAAIVADFEQMLAKIAADYLASRLTDLIMNLVGSLGGKKILGHATGGTIAPGELALVGENGPELFQANAAGTVIPNNKIGSVNGSAPVVVNMTVVTRDANSFRHSKQQVANDLMQAMQRAQYRNG